jgi:hypothetical protein
LAHINTDAVRHPRFGSGRIGASGLFDAQAHQGFVVRGLLVAATEHKQAQQGQRTEFHGVLLVNYLRV